MIFNARVFIAFFGIALATSLECHAQKYNVRILRDKWGVPHVYGKTDADVAFGFAFAQSEDNFRTIQESLMMSRGTLAMHIGQRGIVTDYLVGILNIQEFVNQKYRTDLSPELRAVVEAYAEGLNHYAKKHPNLVLEKNLFPISGKDIIGGFVFKIPFFAGFDQAVRELLGSRRLRPVSEKENHSSLNKVHPAIRGSQLVNEIFTNGDPMGSNGWAISPNRSADRSTMLLSNSHLSWDTPNTWYETHLHSEEGWNVTGGTMAGSPIVSIGHNENLAWTVTVNFPDLVDIYVLEMNPKNENQYRFDGKWIDLKHKQMTIRVKSANGKFDSVKRDLYQSVHGPVIKTPHGVYAIRYVGYGDIRNAEQWYRMGKAKNLEEFRSAIKMQALPSLNIIYADKTGTIWSLYNAKIPKRTEGYNYRNYLPGNTSETLWQKFYSIDELPQVLNPQCGFVQNNNSDPCFMTLGDENPKRKNFPPLAGIETRVTNRTLRALEIFKADKSVDWKEFQSYKFDLLYSRNSEFSKSKQIVLSAPKPKDELLQEAIEIVKKWDLSTHPENTCAALAITAFHSPFAKKAARKNGTQQEKLLDQLADTAHRFKKKYGRLDIRWDKFNRIRKGSVDVGIGGGPDVLHAITPNYSQDGTFSVGRHGDGYTVMVHWNKNGKLTSRSMHQYGASTLNTKSPHFSDQIELMRTRSTKPVWFTEQEIRENLEREYTPYDVD